MAAYITNGQQFHPGLTQDNVITMHIGEQVTAHRRFLTVQLDGDELEAFKWGMANYKKEVLANIEHVYVTPAGFVCTCGHTYASKAGGEASRMANAHKTLHQECDIHDLRRPA